MSATGSSSKNKLYRVTTIDQIHSIAGMGKPSNPLVTIVDYGSITIDKAPESGRFACSFYGVHYKKNCRFSYGRQDFDHQEGSLHCTAPDQIIEYDRDDGKEKAEGWGLFFHPELIRGTSLGEKINSYGFFGYDEYEALHLSDEEKHKLEVLAHQLKKEIDTYTDAHSQDIIVSSIELCLNYCGRYYDRQFHTRSAGNRDVLSRFERYLLEYFASDEAIRKGVPSVRKCAEQMNLSANYFSDMLKSETGKSAREHIQFHLLESAKTMLIGTDLTVDEIAFRLGFEYAQNFSALFKKKIGIPPSQYRAG